MLAGTIGNSIGRVLRLVPVGHLHVGQLILLVHSLNITLQELPAMTVARHQFLVLAHEHLLRFLQVARLAAEGNIQQRHRQGEDHEDDNHEELYVVLRRKRIDTRLVLLVFIFKELAVGKVELTDIEDGVGHREVSSAVSLGGIGVARLAVCFRHRLKDAHQTVFVLHPEHAVTGNLKTFYRLSTVFPLQIYLAKLHERTDIVHRVHVAFLCESHHLLEVILSHMAVVLRHSYVSLVV